MNNKQMVTNLVIVESKGKIASITKYLNSSKELKPLEKNLQQPIWTYL
jgi:hypothetical protein